MHRHLWCCSFLVAFGLILPRVAWADGMSFKGRDFSSMSPVEEGEQRVAIIPRDGREKMIIAVNLPLEDADNALWIFPVPGAPAQVKLDVLDQFPRFYGKDPRQETAEQLAGFGLLLRSTQLWPLPIEFSISSIVMRERAVPANAAEVEVEKWGLSAEVVTVKSLESLAAYLRGKKVGIAPEQLRSFEPYFSDRYALVVVRISSREQLLKEFPGYQQPTPPRSSRQSSAHIRKMAVRTR